MKGYHQSILPADKPFHGGVSELLHPAQRFQNPKQVVDASDLTIDEKRAILASWASDACAVEAAPALRRPPGVARAVSVDDVLEALRTLDRQANTTQDPTWAARQERPRPLRHWGRRTRGREDFGSALLG